MGYTNSHGFSKGGGKCPKPGYSAGHRSRTAVCKCIYRKRHMTDVSHGADVAAVNVGQGEPLRCCPQKSLRVEGSSPLPTIQEKRCQVDTSWAGGTSRQFAWEHTQGRAMTDITLHRQLGPSAWGLDTLWIFSVSSRSSACLTWAPEFPTYPSLLSCVQNNFHINLDQKSREFHQLKTNTHMMNSVAEQKWSVG